MRVPCFAAVVLTIVTCVAAPPVRADPAPATRPGAPGSDVKITIDTSQATDLAAWAEHDLRPVLTAWYPKIVAELPVPGYTPPAGFSVVFETGYKGVAYTSGTHVGANPAWFRTQVGKEAVGALLHEEVHVVQQPFHVPSGHHVPTWLLEGSCDYIRWFQFEPAAARPHPHAAKAKYDASYRVTATFLRYVVDKYDKQIVAQMNAANYDGTYSDDLWVKYTGHSAADLGAEWKATLPQ